MNTAVLSFKITLRRTLARWQTIAGLDFHVLVTLLFRGWAIVAGGATVFLLPMWLSPTEQGYYFTFASVLALQIFFELGLNQIVMQLVSHEVAHLSETTDGRFTGNEPHLARLSSLARLIRRWYSVVAVLFALIGGIAGVVFFTQKGTEPMSVWLAVWVVLVGATAVNLWLSPGLAVMEGCGKVGQVARLRLVQSVLGYAILWVALLSGAGLWAATALPVMSAVCTGYWLTVHGNVLRWLSIRATDMKNQIRWRTDILPLQWRIALSWISGYFIFHLFNPIIFANQGAVEAGKIGMSLAIFSSLLTLSMSWINAKTPVFAAHIARKERQQLNDIFVRVTKISIIFTIISSFTLLLFVNFVGMVFPGVTNRVAGISVLICIALVTVANNFIFAAATYMRSHKEEPMLAISMVVGMASLLVIFIGSRYSVLLPMALYAFVTIFIALPWTYIVFLRYFRRLN